LIQLPYICFYFNSTTFNRMTDIEKLHRLKLLISKARIETALDEVVDSGWIIETDARVLQARLALIVKQERIGTGGWKEIQSEKLVIAKSLLELLEEARQSFNSTTSEETLVDESEVGKILKSLEAKMKVDNSSKESGADEIERELEQIKSQLASDETSEEVGLKSSPFKHAAQWLSLHKEGLSIKAAAKAVGKKEEYFFKLEIERLLTLVKGCLVVADRDMLDGLVYVDIYTVKQYSTAFSYIRGKIVSKLKDEGFKELNDILILMEDDLEQTI
jgi:hypothetical protein